MKIKGSEKQTGKAKERLRQEYKGRKQISDEWLPLSDMAFDAVKCGFSDKAIPLRDSCFFTL